MAPTKPKKISSVQVASTHPASMPQSNVASSKYILSKAHPTSKKEKRSKKHSTLLSRIEKSHKKDLVKRRRPSKKLVANLDNLLDALPKEDEITVRGTREKKGGELVQKSLKSRPGFLKRKAKLEREEKERFGRNLAQIIGAGLKDANAQVNESQPAEALASSPESTSTSTKFAAIRAWACANMELHPDFKKNK